MTKSTTFFIAAFYLFVHQIKHIHGPALVVASRRRVGAKQYVINRENRSP